MRLAIGRLAALGMRWRIAAWAATVMLACLAIAFVAVYSGTGTQIRDQIDHEIAGDGHDLTHALLSSHAGTASALAATATRYVRGRPFSSSATLLFVLVPGQTTSTNRPELFTHSAPDNGETAAEQAQENRLAANLLTAPLGYSTQAMPDVGDLRIVKRALHPAGVGLAGQAVTVGVGEPLAAVSHAQEGVARAFILAALLAVLGALAGGWLIGSRASQPLRRMAAVASRVDAGDLHPRIHTAAGTPGEVRVLAAAFNHMLDRLTAAFASQSAFVADASHELRTPLAVIRGQLELLLEEDSPSVEEVRRVEQRLHTEVLRIGRLIDDLLLLTELEQEESLQRERIELEPFLAEAIAAIEPLEERRYRLGEVPRGTLLADPDRLAQALRNLLGNAIKHTREGTGEIALSCERRPGDRVVLAVEDDGPGIPEAERERIFERFHRTDVARSRARGGAGLGLAIVEAIARAHHGSVRAGDAALGGARLELELPGFAPLESGASDGVLTRSAAEAGALSEPPA